MFLNAPPVAAMADMKALLAEASTKLEDAARRSGMPGVGNVVEKLDSIKEEAGKGHDGVLKQIVDIFNDFQMTLEKALANPASLAPGGNCAAPLAKWYGDKVVQKLGAVKSEGREIIDLFHSLSKTIAELLKEIKKTMKDTMPAISKEIKELLELPTLLTNFATEVEAQGPKAIATLDMEAVNKSLDVAPINEPLDKVDGIKGSVGPQIEETQRGVQRLSKFKQTVPNKVKNAFNVCPCVPVTNHAPPVMQELLQKLDNLKTIDLTPLIDMLTNMKTHINKFDAQKCKGPLEDYSTRAQEILHPLSDAVEEAKKVAGAATLVQGGTDAFMKGDMKGGMTAMSGAFKTMF